MLDRITGGLPLPGMGVARWLLRELTGSGANPTRTPAPAPAPAPGRTPRADTPPQYVDYGALMTPPAPFRSLDTTLYGFWAQADPERLRALCAKVFSEPSGGAVSCRPISRHLMITWGQIARVSSRTPPYDQRGGVAEPQVAIWVPVLLRDPTRSGERLAMFIPYIWLDNAMSLADGRELFGYPKSWGWLRFPPKRGRQVWKVDAFGLNYARDALAARHPLLEVVRSDSPTDTVAEELGSLEELARDMARRLLAKNSFLEDVELGLELARDVLDDRMRGVFLKQFRDVGDGLAAALQQIVEADYTILSLKAAPILSPHQLTVHPLDSHPVATELGLQDQPLELAYRVEMNFDVGGGRVLWDAARR
jgi:Acetoacetate decarboxylase (ADC)